MVIRASLPQEFRKCVFGRSQDRRTGPRSGGASAFLPIRAVGKAIAEAGIRRAPVATLMGPLSLDDGQTPVLATLGDHPRHVTARVVYSHIDEARSV